GKVEQGAVARNPLHVKYVKFGFAEWSCDLVLNDFDSGSGAGHHIAFFDCGDAANVHADGGVELQSAATGGGFGIAEHHADFFADLINKDQAGARLRDNAGQLAQRLRHQPRLQSHVAVAHFAIEFGLRNQGGHSSGGLSLRNYLQCDGGFAGRFWAENFDHASARKAANAKSSVE